MGRSSAAPVHNSGGSTHLADGHSGGFAFDLGNVVGGELEFAGAHYAFGLFGAARTDDRAGHGRVEQSPGDGNFAGGAAVAFADGAEAFDEFEILRKFWLAEFRFVAAPVVGGKI